MKTALYFEKLKNSMVRCTLCPSFCIIKNNSIGNCSVRKNCDGVLYSMIYKKTISINIDPIEKKPLYHFLPGSKTLSIGTIGCNLKCSHCQNHEISQITDTSLYKDMRSFEYMDIIELAIKNGCRSISFTYNEPIVSIETIIELSKKSKEFGLKNILVTNGFINEIPLRDLLKNIDAVNIDLKSFNNNFYKNICRGTLAPVLKTIEICSSSIHTEITFLVLENKNDNIEEVRRVINFIYGLDKNIPLHFSKSYPMYKMQDLHPTNIHSLIQIKNIAKTKLNHVYIGNCSYFNEIECQKCKSKNLENGFCLECGEKLYGLFNDEII